MRCMLFGGSHAVPMTSIHSPGFLYWQNHNRSLMAFIFMFATKMYQHELLPAAVSYHPYQLRLLSSASISLHIYVCCWCCCCCAALLLQSSTVYRAHCMSIAFSCFLLQTRTNFSLLLLSFFVHWRRSFCEYRVITRSPQVPNPNEKRKME